jgi:hypothetical protein
MKFEIITTNDFDNAFKKLAKKHYSLKNDLLEFLKTLPENPLQGKSLGNNFYKIRLKISSKNAGKSGGARIITFVKIVSNKVYLTYIYDKSDDNSVTDEKLKEWAKMLN